MIVSLISPSNVLEAVVEVARNYPNSVVTDGMASKYILSSQANICICPHKSGVVYPHVTLAEVLRLLRVHLFSHVVRIPTGSSSSAANGEATLPFTQVRKNYFPDCILISTHAGLG